MITNNSRLDANGFSKASESAGERLKDIFHEIEKPEERRRAMEMVDEFGNDKKVITALVKSEDFGLSTEEAEWAAQYAIHDFRRGNDDIVGALETAARRTPETQSIPGSKFSTDIGIEYEMNVPGTFDFTNENEEIDGLPHEDYFVRRNSEELVEQETGPRTLEIISDVYPSIDMAVDAMMQRELFAEEFINSNNVNGIPNKPVRKHSGDHKTYHPGVHIHIDPEDHSDPQTTEDVIKHFAPELSFATANAIGEVNGKEVLSTRQAKSLGGGYPRGYALTDETIELRMPDIPRDRDSWTAVTAICLGTAKNAELQSFAPSNSHTKEDFRNNLEQVAENGKIGSRTVDEMMESMNYEKFNPDTEVLTALYEGPQDQEKYDTFTDGVETGLYMAGYRPDDIMETVNRHLDKQWQRVNQLN